tara:strand:- start:119 stop:304 length:186 start_codon:yes stop_codon:yes gene_type:complete
MIKIYFVLIFIYLNSCGYPDIDTVPDFNKLKLTKDELFDLCELSSDDKSGVDKCIKEKQEN